MRIFWAASVPTHKANANLTGLSAHSPPAIAVSANVFSVASSGRPASTSLHSALALRAIRCHPYRNSE